MDIFFGRKTALSVSSHPLLPWCSLRCFQPCPCNGLVSLLWNSSLSNQKQHKLFKKWGFLRSSVICLCMVAPLTVILVGSSTAWEGPARPCRCPGCKGNLGKTSKWMGGLGGLIRLAWLLCRHGGSRDFQSLQTLPTAGPLLTPYVSPLIASPSCWMTWSSLLFPRSETVPTLRWGQHLRSSYCQLQKDPTTLKIHLEAPSGKHHRDSWILCTLVWGETWDKEGWDFGRAQSTSGKSPSF